MQNFKRYESIKYRAGDDINRVIETIAGRFMGANPILPFTYRAFSKDGYMQLSDGRVLIDLRDKNAELGSFAYATASLYMDGPLNNFDLGLNCFGPTTIYHNGQHLFTSGTYEEVDNTFKQVVFVNLVPGWNVFFLKMECVTSGFGCTFGSARDSLNPMRYHSPFLERQGQAGFLVSEICKTDIFPDEIPMGDGSEADTGLIWYPKMNWDEKKGYQLERMYSLKDSEIGFGITEFETDYIQGSANYKINVKSKSETAVYIDDTLIIEKSGDFSENFPISFGRHKLVVKSQGYEIEILNDNGEKIEFISPCNIKGSDEKWMYIAPFNKDTKLESKDIGNLDRVIEDKYYRLDAPNVYVRPYIDNILFGRWNYPLGVTLLGLIRCGDETGRQDIIDYAVSHITKCADVYKYGLWDQKMYGYPSVDQKLIELTMLDDCGSCGSTMLDVYEKTKNPELLVVADVIYDFIRNKVDRQPDGAYFRIQPGKFHDNTLWADDLYMSVPFLTKYYKITGNEEALNDAAKQFLLYKEYLFMSDKSLMGHVFDFKFNVSNKLAWGRGNGWVLFSLTEILERMPKNHSDRPKLIEFFRELSVGILKVQGENGIWHQLLTDSTSYEETSCTSMYIYAFCRGIRYDLYEEADKAIYLNAAKKAWNGIIERTIDFSGNVYGVCWGSRYAFKPSYYTKELGWAKNDTHGTGITMLAGIEYKRLQRHLTS